MADMIDELAAQYPVSRENLEGGLILMAVMSAYGYAPNDVILQTLKNSPHAEDIIREARRLRRSRLGDGVELFTE